MKKKKKPNPADVVIRIMSRKAIMRVRACQLVVLKLLITLTALSGAALCDSARAEQIETVAQVARRIDARLGQMDNIAAGDKATALAQSFLTDLDLLKRQSIMVVGEREKRLEEESDNLRRGLASWSTDAVGNPTKRRILLADISQGWKKMKSQWPAEALEILPTLWSCPMHPELIESAAGTCPVCGMSLEPIYVAQPQLSTAPIIRA